MGAGFSATLMAEVIYNPKILLPYQHLGESEPALTLHLPHILASPAVHDCTIVLCCTPLTDAYYAKHQLCCSAVLCEQQAKAKICTL